MLLTTGLWHRHQIVSAVMSCWNGLSHHRLSLSTVTSHLTLSKPPTHINSWNVTVTWELQKKKKRPQTPSGLVSHISVLSKCRCWGGNNPFSLFTSFKSSELSHFQKSYCQKHSTNWQHKTEHRQTEQIAPFNFVNNTEVSPWAVWVWTKVLMRVSVVWV